MIKRIFLCGRFLYIEEAMFIV